MAAQLPVLEGWSDAWLARDGAVWRRMAASLGPCSGTGIASQWWPDQAIGIGPALIAAMYAQLLAWGESTPQQRIKQPVKRQAARVESGVAVQLALPI